MSIKNLARRLAAARMIKEIVDREAKRLSAELETQMAELGIRAMDPVDLNGDKMAAINLTAGRRTAIVTDGRAFLEWVRTHYPDEIMSTVNPAFEERLRRDALTAGLGVGPGGELLEFIQIRQGDPYIAVKLDPEALGRTSSWVLEDDEVPQLEFKKLRG